MKKHQRIMILSGVVALLFPFFANAEQLDGPAIRELLSDRVIANIAYSRADNYQKLIQADGTWIGLTNDGKLVGTGSWNVSNEGLFCQRNRQSSWHEQCVTIHKEGDHYVSYEQKNSQGSVINWRAGAWKVIADPPAVIAYKDRQREERAKIAAAFEQKTGREYQTAVVEGKQEIDAGYEAMVADYKKKAIKAVPAAGPR